MAKLSPEASEVNARIVYWGIAGAGKSQNLRSAYSKLRPDHRGEIREVPSRLDPTATYEVLPISLGEVAGVKTQLEMVAVPGGDEQRPTRKQLLDRVDGVVLIIDAAASVDENLDSLDELIDALGAYGRSLADLPLVVQYNKRDVAGPYALEDLHRKLEVGDSPVFEAVASEGIGVLQTLSTISKRVIRALREQPAPASPAHDEPLESPEEPTPQERMVEAIEAEASAPEADALDATARDAAALLESPAQVSGEIPRPEGARLGPDLSIVSVGTATRGGDRSVRIPLVLGDASGGTSSVVLTVQLEALVEGDRE